MNALFRLDIAIGIFAVAFKRYGFNACFIAIKKIKGTDIEILLKESGLIE